ncbi:MAG: hypothetical protein ABJD07_08625 [Gemmatimonadaceae bacterium]
MSRTTDTRRPLVLAAALVAFGAIALANPAHAQAQMPGTAAKAAAQRAVDATNAHTETVTRDQEKTPPQGTKGGAQPHSSASQKGSLPAGVPMAQPSTTPVQRPTTGAKGSASGALTPPAGTVAGGVAKGDGKNPGELALMREAFTYENEARRDPFVSLLASGELRPMIQDLRLVAVIYDVGGRSVAILRDVSAKEQYRVKVGQALGRMRVVQITPRAVTFTLEEFGYSRQEVLALNVQPK